MKKIFNRLPLYVLAAFSLHSCVKLEQEPFNELSEHKSFLNIEDAQYWVNGMYDGLRENTYGNAMYSTDVQADFLNAVRRNNETLPEIHRWSTFTSSNATTAAIWMAYYKAIQDINIALKGIPNIPIVQERERVERAQIQRNLGELYLGRAYYYTYLVTHFCGAYDESSAYGLPIVKEIGALDGLWLNAAYAVGGAIETMDKDSIAQMFQVNVFAPMLQMGALSPYLKEGASVVVTSSSAVYEGQPNVSLYSASKAAILSAARCWAAELAPRHIRVNTLVPGPIKSNLRAVLPDELRQQFEEDLAKVVLLKRVGEPNEASAVALFLLSDEASYVTGSSFTVDGGLLMQ